MLTDTQKEVLIFLVRKLQENNIEFQISGGLAVIVHGGTRPLYDIDLEVHKEDREKVRELFKEFITEDWNNDLEPDDQFDIWIIKLEVTGVPIDINQIEDVYLISKSGERALQPSDLDFELKEFEGMSLPVHRKEALIAYKKILGRDVDLVDVEHLSNNLISPS